MRKMHISGRIWRRGINVLYAVRYQVKQALLLKDNEWLTYMSYLLKNKKLYDALSEDKKYQKIMRRYYESYWGELKY